MVVGSEQTEEQQNLVTVYNLLCFVSFFLIFGTNIAVAIQNILHACFFKGGEYNWIDDTVENIKTRFKRFFCIKTKGQLEKTDDETFRAINGADVYMPSVKINIHCNLICADVEFETTQLPEKYLRNVHHEDSEVRVLG